MIVQRGHLAGNAFVMVHPERRATVLFSENATTVDVARAPRHLTMIAVTVFYGVRRFTVSPIPTAVGISSSLPGDQTIRHIARA